jgi:hypothetical protein
VETEPPFKYTGWPKGEPVIGKPVYLNGGSVSTNEA